ncbi:MAG: ABC transporter permease, partial [Betaproteobacteria bacterium]
MTARERPQRPAAVGKWLVSLPPVVYLLVFFAVPALIMVLASFRTPGEFGGLAPLTDEAGRLDLTAESYVRFFAEPVYLQVFIKSAWYAALTTLLCLLLAYPLASLIAKSPRRYRELLLLLVILPFWSNFLIRVYAWMIILGPNAALARVVNSALSIFGLGPVPLLFSAFAVLTCLVYVHLPFMVLPLYANLEKHDQALLDAAQDLGANAWHRFWRV